MSKRFRSIKNIIRANIATPQWPKTLDELLQLPPLEIINPLISCLPIGGEKTQYAAEALGEAVAQLAHNGSIEDARNILRRLMWHMNEESGNIGWGIPEAFVEILIRHRTLAEEFSKILISYIINTGVDDNYCDHDVLRRSCYSAVGKLAKSWPDLAQTAKPYLEKAYLDPDKDCQKIAQSTLKILKKDQ